MAHFKPWPVKLKRVINSHSKMTLSSLSSEEVRRPYQKRKVATHTCMCIHLYPHSYYLVFICNEVVKLRAMYLSQKKKKNLEPRRISSMGFKFEKEKIVCQVSRWETW